MSAGSDVKEASLCCSTCARDYELPRRHTIQLGDHDFSPIPRLLPCLHTLCHSCIQAQVEDRDDHVVECPLCGYKESLTNTDLLPLDLSILKQLVEESDAELPANCARCIDPVPSTSWCETCSSALCEFHHQDHKLSVDTSRHNIQTLSELTAQGKTVMYKFPPLSCPQCPMQDCSLFCHSCLHLLSPKAFIDYHQGHQVSALHSFLCSCTDLDLGLVLTLPG